MGVKAIRAFLILTATVLPGVVSADFGGGNSGDSVVFVALLLGGFLLFLLVLREFFCWYLKINQECDALITELARWQEISSDVTRLRTLPAAPLVTENVPMPAPRQMAAPPPQPAMETVPAREQVQSPSAAPEDLPSSKAPVQDVPVHAPARRGRIFVWAFVVLLAVVGSMFALNWYQERKFQVSQAEAAQFVDRWTALQNQKAFGEYRALYAGDFQGVRRSKNGSVRTLGIAQWLDERAAFFRPGKHQSIVVEKVAFKEYDGTKKLTSVRFTQKRLSNSKVSEGVKQLKLRKVVDGTILIVEEEMIN